MAFALKYKLILGSQSPRRKELLEKLGFEFKQISLNADETFPHDLPPDEVAEYLSRKKAAAGVSGLRDDELLITSDTTVVIDNNILNKAADQDEAKAMLEQLSGKEHQVISGVCLSSKEKATSFSVRTKVLFKKLTADEIEYYIDRFKPYDKAGAYGIQEWIGMIGVEKIEGSFYNVMGLPVKEVFEEILKF